MIKRLSVPILAYIVPTFALGFAWHLVLFKHYYEQLAMYRQDVIIPFGLLSMLIQAVLFAWIYDSVFARGERPWQRAVIPYAALGALLSWSFTTIAVAAKNVMTSVPDYLLIETAFTAVQWAIVGPLTAWAFSRLPHRR
jgi:glucan phosphoethanolaminetransferase (alkaline phosphatase superfamily)